MTIPETTRDFTVAVFVVHAGKVLMHPHAKLGIWLPPGGHIEPNELPDEAAIREVREETGLDIELLGERGVTVSDPAAPQQLVRPLGIQLENIHADHQHIDLIYLARPLNAPRDTWPDVSERMEWLAADELVPRGVNEEVTAWSRRALDLAPSFEANTAPHLG